MASGLGLRSGSGLRVKGRWLGLVLGLRLGLGLGFELRIGVGVGVRIGVGVGVRIGVGVGVKMCLDLENLCSNLRCVRVTHRLRSR